jgi:DNA-binding transcriptional MerR regulator
MLQQILFFRELGFPLNEIQTLLIQSDFDKIEALYMHKSILEEDINRKNRLISTIDKITLLNSFAFLSTLCRMLATNNYAG